MSNQNGKGKKPAKQRSKQAQPPRARIGSANAIPARPPRWWVQANTPWGTYGGGSGTKPKNARSRNARNLEAPLTNGGEAYAYDSIPGVPFKKREILGYISGSVSFAATSYAIQPGLATFAPWLSDIARKFEKYRFKRLVFEYKSTVSEYALPGQQGRIVLLAVYDAQSNTPVNMQQAEETQPNIPGKTPQCIRLELSPFELNGGSTGKYVRTGLVPSGGDIKTFDAGRLIFCTEGMADGSRIGEVWVDYELELIKPLLLPMSTAPPVNTNVFRAQSVGYGLANTVDNLVPTWTVTENNIDATVSTSWVTLHAGHYMVACSGIINANTGALVNSRQSYNMNLLPAANMPINGFAIPAAAGCTTVYFNTSGTVTVPEGMTIAVNLEIDGSTGTVVGEVYQLTIVAL